MVEPREDIYDLELRGTLDDKGGHLIPEAMLPEVDRQITGTYMVATNWFTVYEGHPQPRKRRIDRYAYRQRRQRVRWWIHNRLFPDCYGQDYT